MLCEQCKSRQAVVLIRERRGSEVKERWLCGQCASDSEIGPLLEQDSFGRFLSGLLGVTTKHARENEGGAQQLTCQTCGLTYGEFTRNGRFGCGDCYSTFGPLIHPLIRNVQGGSVHSGKKPAASGEETRTRREAEPDVQTQIEVLKEKQKEAIRDEDYEKAAHYRDEIRRLKEEIGQQ